MKEAEKTTVYGKVKGMNSSNNKINIVVELPDSSIMNIKTEKSCFIEKDYIYKFIIQKSSNLDRVVYSLLEFEKVADLNDVSEINYIYRLFDKRNPEELDNLINEINNYVNKIKNKIIKEIVQALLKENFNKFYIYPAAIRLHHSYVGGLAYHTLGMLRLCDGFIKNYEFLSSDYLYGGTILHDIGKIVEFTGVENSKYAVEGQLLGHLVIGGFFLRDMAKKLGYENSEEVLLLEHEIISHHGLLNYGACKKPQTAEALVLWYVDSIDSKLRVLGEQLKKTDVSKFTDSIGVLDKVRFYNHK